MKTKHLLALIISMLIAPILHAQSYSVSLEDAFSEENLCNEMKDTQFQFEELKVVPRSIARENYLTGKLSPYAVIPLDNTSDEVEKVTLTLTTSKGGELLALLGDNQMKVDSLTISGPLNDDDFGTLWNASFYGLLEYLDLKNVILEDGMFPEYALYRTEQTQDGYIYPICLKKIIFPDCTNTIGKWSLSYAIYLEEAIMPDGVKVIDKAAFQDCRNLKNIPHFPTSLEVIGEWAFCNDQNMTGVSELPEGLKVVDYCAFYYTHITVPHLPSTLEKIGTMAFTRCDMRDVIIPKGCNDFGHTGAGHQFSSNYDLKSVQFLNSIRSLPSCIFESGLELEDVELPESLEVIEYEAFYFCENLRRIRIPEKVEIIQSDAFAYCTGLEKIYCKATVPPKCRDNYVPTEYRPVFSGVPTSIPVYIPTRSKSLYQAEPGWSQFTNFIEVDNFPTSDIEEIGVDDISDAPVEYFNLQGICVANPAAGQIVIRRQGSKVTKVIF